MRLVKQHCHAGGSLTPLGAASTKAAKHSGETSVKLYGYFRSSAAYRVRIALNLKNLSHEQQSVHLTRNGGWQWSEEYRAVNPQKRVPALALDNGTILVQSLAIIEYLEEVHPQPPLLPADPAERAEVRAVSQIIACDIHPLNNLAALNYLKGPLQHDQSAVDEWYRHWVMQGLQAVEALLGPGPYAFGAHVTVADLCLVPQVFNARRFKVDMGKYPKIASADAACLKLPAFDKARPENQPDAE
jgi:maleylacetoacetate isomerase